MTGTLWPRGLSYASRSASSPKNTKRSYRPYIPVRPSPRPMFDNLQPASWDGHSVSLGIGFELQEAKGDRGVHAVCSRQTLRFGWEVVLE